MGVHGLTPFLRKAWVCSSPTVIRNLPERFRGLSGKRLVIDGTLITQRFHFIPDKHPYQHIISWYRFVQELQEHGVSAICIFDGKQRNQAKAREARRRRDVRELTLARASIEQDRFARLTRVQTTLHSFRKLRDVDRLKVAGMLATDPSFGDVESSDFLDGGDGLEESFPPLLRDERSSEEDLSSVDVTEERSVSDEPLINAAGVVSQLKSSFLGFKANVAKLVTLSTDTDQPPSPPPTNPSQEEDEHVEKLMSKSQYGLTVNESQFWKDCLSTLTGGDDTLAPREIDIAMSPHDQLESLVDKSSVMVSMYERRSDVPTQETYRQARQILKALGVPCIEVADTYEAEALASSIVLGGLADYVVSEDTDVLVYEAPLVRNMTTQNPLLVVSGTDVRQTLQLTRDEYVDFAILLGTDFSQRITNVGPVRALSFIKEMGCIENVVDSIEHHPRYQLKLPKAAYLAQVNIARSVFKTLPPLPSSQCFESVGGSDEEAAGVLEMYGILRGDIYPDCPGWRHEDALVGNYYNDTPVAA